jgi:hypothetical protein
VFAIPMTLFEGDLMFYLVYTLSYLHHIAFYSYLPNLPSGSLIMPACIWLTMLVTALPQAKKKTSHLKRKSPKREIKEEEITINLPTT